MSVRTTELSKSDDSQFHALFRDVFKTDISDALIGWKYDAGRGRRYGVFSDEDRLLAHCGLTFRQTLVEGERRRIAQLTDLMATRSKPGGLTRGSSVFHHLIAHVYANVADAENPDALTYGFPSGRAMRLGEQLGLAVSIGVMHELTLLMQTRTERRLTNWRVKPANFDAALSRVVNRLWHRMAEDFRADVLGVRDANFMRHRYAEHPENQYEFFVVSTWWNKPVALIVGKREGAAFEVMDIVAARIELPAAIDALRQSALLPGVESLRMWLTDQHAKVFVQTLGCTSSELQFRLVVNYNSSGGNLNRFEGRWWLTGGDTDYR